MKALILAACVAMVAATPALSHEDPNEPKRFYAQGEVQKVDLEEKTITLKHSPLDNLRKPAATSTFPVKNPDMLKKAKPGDKVLFSARNINGTVMISTLEAADAAGHKH